MLSTCTQSVGGGGDKEGSLYEAYAQKILVGKAGPRKKGWQSWWKTGEGPLLEFLKATEVGSREEARERELEWERRNDHAGESLLSD